MLEYFDSVCNFFTQQAPSLINIWNIIKDIANSNFTAALAGAMIGALTANRISKKIQNKDELKKEFLQLNAAISLATATLTISLSLKINIVKELKTSYSDGLKKRKDHECGIENGTIDPETPFKLKVNLSVLQNISPPISAIQDIVFNRLSVPARGIAATAALSSAIENLNSALSRRNEILQTFNKNEFPEGATFEDFYFGLTYGDRQTNTEYGDIITAIYTYTNDVIFFSTKLCDDLQSHALTLNTHYKTQTKEKPPIVTMYNIPPKMRADFIPADKEYKSWLSGFTTSSSMQ